MKRSGWMAKNDVGWKFVSEQTFIQHFFASSNIIFMLDWFKRGFHSTHFICDVVEYLHIFSNERLLFICFKTNSKSSALIQNISLNPILSSIITSRIILLKYPLTLLLFIYNMVSVRLGFSSSESINSDYMTSIWDCSASIFNLQF